MNSVLRYQAFVDFAGRMRPEIDQALDRYTQYGDDCPAELREAIRYSLLAPGKRLRPLLVFMAADVCGCPATAAMPAACAVEMVHCYSLVHDDLPAMDNDRLRRGRPTCHVKYGETLAILVGDALLAQAFHVLSQLDRPAVCVTRCCRELAMAAGPESLVGGQVDDLAGLPSDSTSADLDRVHRRKTGALFRVSLRMGAILGNATAQSEAALDRYAQNLGLAFQIVDDLLDVRGSTEALGKTVGKDAAQGKVTYPFLLGESTSRQRAADLIADARRALEVFGGTAAHLDALAQYVLERDR
jgi:geranylgeranyl diphosphate synthase, type II